MAPSSVDTPQIIAIAGEVSAVSARLTDLKDHVRSTDSKMDAMAADVITISIQVGALDTHVTQSLKNQDKISVKLESLTNLKFQVLGGMGVISFLLFVSAELLRIWFH